MPKQQLPRPNARPLAPPASPVARSPIQKRKKLGPATGATRLDVQQYMRSWSAEEDAVLLDALDQFGARWKLIAGAFPDRSEAMCRNRYQRIMAPKKEGRSCTSRNKCKRCGQMKRGHTCTVDELYVETTPLPTARPSPLMYDSLGLIGDIVRPLALPGAGVAPSARLSLQHPYDATMSMAAGNTREDELQMAHEVVVDVDDDALASFLFDSADRPTSASLTVRAEDEDEEGGLLEGEAEEAGEGEAGEIRLPTPVPTATPTPKTAGSRPFFCFDLQQKKASTFERAADTRLAQSAEAALAAAEMMADEEVAAALAKSEDPTAAAAAAAGAAGAAAATAPPLPPPAFLPPPPPTFSRGFSSATLSGLLGASSTSFDGHTNGYHAAAQPLPCVSKQSSVALFWSDLVYQASRGGGSPPPALDAQPPSLERFVSLENAMLLGIN